jgi:hypothetical protein
LRKARAFDGQKIGARGKRRVGSGGILRGLILKMRRTDNFGAGAFWTRRGAWGRDASVMRRGADGREKCREARKIEQGAEKRERGAREARPISVK